MSSGVVQPTGALEHPAPTTEPSGRDWNAIGAGLAAALAVIALYVMGIWAVVVLVEALA